MDHFNLEENESYDQRCGEIFKTTKGRISFHCTICEDVCFEFDLFLAHLNEAHLSTTTENEINKNDDIVEPLGLTEFVVDFIELSDEEDYCNDLKKDKIRFSESEQTDKHLNNCLNNSKPDIEDGTQQKQTNKQLSKTTNNKNDFQSPPLIIPTEIREIIKRKVYKPQTIADEERKHKCPICNMGFKDKYNMTHHFKRHSNQRNFACSECGKKFFTSTELNTHIKHIHTKERSLLCPECGLTFLTNSSLGVHIKRHRNQRDYICQICEKAFFNAKGLTEHERRHYSERPYSCSICGAAFKRHIALKNHLKLHENKRQYKCDLCEARFNQNAGLFSHKKTAHKLA